MKHTTYESKHAQWKKKLFCVGILNARAHVLSPRIPHSETSAGFGHRKVTPADFINLPKPNAFINYPKTLLLLFFFLVCMFSVCVFFPVRFYFMHTFYLHLEISFGWASRRYEIFTFGYFAFYAYIVSIASL